MWVGLLFLLIGILILWELSYWVLFSIWLERFKPANKSIPKRYKRILPIRENIIIPNIAKISSPKPIGNQTNNYPKDSNKDDINNRTPNCMYFGKFIVIFFEDEEANISNNNKENNGNKYILLSFPHDFVLRVFDIIKRLSTKCKQNH